MAFDCNNAKELNDSTELKVRVESDFAFIYENFSFLLQSVTRLEKTTNLLSNI